MRISGFVLGILGFLALIPLTGICAFASYTITRDGVVDLWSSGIYVESVAEVGQALLNPADFEAQATSDAPPATNAPLVIPSITPMTTAIPTTSVETNNTDMPIISEATVAIELEPTIEATEQFASQIWGDPREVNILLMGIDERAGFTEENAYRTDTMMVLHIDPVRRTAGLISFPRDLYVDVPGYGQNRLNQANYIGDLNFYPDDQGPGLLMETLNRNFGIRINYYVMINFTVFETVVDRIAPNGIEICVDQYINDPTYPDAGFGTMQVEFQVGCQQLSGERLLQYARTRKTEGGDIDRTERQQQVIEATRQYVLSAGGIQNFITQIGTLWNDLTGSYRTNLTLSEITGLGGLMNDVRDISYTSITPGYWLPQTLENGDQILVPIPSEIQRLIQETFYPVATLSTADYRALAEQENVQVRVFNNTTISGLAGNTREYLLGQGVTTDEVGNMPQPDNSQTTIYYYNSGRNTAFYLAQVLGLPSDRIERGRDGLMSNGVLIAAGSDMPTIISRDNP
ncbi:MAG: LCP family protein [Anaerolineae bacterium]